MTQNRYGVFVSLCLLFLLTGGFFVAARMLFDKVHSSVATAVATSTATVIVFPTATVASRPTATKKAGSVHPHALPTSTPLPQDVRVVINTSPSTINPLTSIPSDANQVWCVAKLPGIPLGSPLVFRFQKLSTPGDYYHYPTQVDGGTQSAYLLGPLQTGQWRCLVEVNGKLAGTAPFTIS